MSHRSSVAGLSQRQLQAELAESFLQGQKRPEPHAKGPRGLDKR